METAIRKLDPRVLWGIFGALCVISYWPTLKWMVERWEEEGSYSSHGWLIPFISLWVIWNIRGKLASLPSGGTSLGFLLVLTGLCVHLMSGLADVSSLSGLSLLPLIAGFALLQHGTLRTREAWFAIAFLFFMVPLPEFIISGLNFRLKFMASDVAVWLLDTSGLAVIREGSFLLFQNERLAIGDVCSGLRSLISLVALGILYAYLMRSRGKLHVLALLLTIVPAAVFGNGLRIFLVAYLVQWFGSETVFSPIYGDLDIHLLTGFFIFAGAFSCMYGVSAIMDKLVPGKDKGDRA